MSMNEHIKRLAVEAGIDLDQHGGIARAYPQHLERFAQAVARECAEMVDNSDCGPVPHRIGDQIRARFGLEG